MIKNLYYRICVECFFPTQETDLYPHIGDEMTCDLGYHSSIKIATC